MKTSRRRVVARLLACVVAAIAIESVESFKIKIRRGESECIYATFESDDAEVCANDRVVVHGRFVGETHAGTLSGRVASTNGTTMQEFQFMKRGKEDEREVELATRGCGVYSACFTQEGREGENILSASVMVDYFQALHEPDASEPTKHSGKAKRRDAMQKSEEAMRADAVSDVSAKVSGLNNWVQQMREELNYLTARTARHKQTVESNARRTVRTTFIEVCVLIAVTCVQIVTVKRFFDVQTRSHDQHRARARAFSADVFGRAAFRVNRVAGPMAGAAVDAAQRGVSGLMKSLGRAPRASDFHLG